MGCHPLGPRLRSELIIDAQIADRLWLAALALAVARGSEGPASLRRRGLDKGIPASIARSRGTRSP